MRQELRDPALARNVGMRRRRRLRAAATTRKRRRSSTRSTRPRKGFLDSNPDAALHRGQVVSRASNQCTKAVAAYKRLLPMMKKGTKDYDNVRRRRVQHRATRRSTQADRLRFVTDPLYAEHLRGVAHPERPGTRRSGRGSARGKPASSRRALAGTRRDRGGDRARARPAYLELVDREDRSADGARYLSTGDTVVDAGVVSRPLGAPPAARSSPSRRPSRQRGGVFALVRPPGPSRRTRSRHGVLPLQ